jgi:hypothetical protein
MASPITSQLTICNSALLKIGADVINSLVGNQQRAAVACNTLFQYLADEVMGESPWTFAMKQATLAPNATTPLFTWQYTYDIPSDCLRPLFLDNDQIPWVVENGNQILCNEPTLNLTYLYRNTDFSTWDARFCEALAWRMAMELALALVRSIPLKQEAEKSYNAAIANARSMNAVIGTRPRLEADIWSGARKGRGYWRASIGQAGNGASYDP